MYIYIHIYIYVEWGNKINMFMRNSKSATPSEQHVEWGNQINVSSYGIKICPTLSKQDVEREIALTYLNNGWICIYIYMDIHVGQLLHGLKTSSTSEMDMYKEPYKHIL